MKVLIIDDDPTMRAILGTLLQNSGHHVLLAQNGDDGIDILTRTEEIELVITDLDMVDGDGIKVLQSMNGHERYADTKRWLMSGRFPMGIETLGKNLGAERVFLKPLIVEQLQEAGIIE